MSTIERHNKCKVPKTWIVRNGPFRMKHHLIAIIPDTHLTTDDGTPIDLIVSRWYSRRKGWVFCIEQRWLFGYSRYEIQKGAP